MKSDEQRPWLACQTLVQGIVRVSTHMDCFCMLLTFFAFQRKRDTRWQIPQHVISAFRRLESLTAPQEASAGTKAAQEQVHSVIRVRNGPLLVLAACVRRSPLSFPLFDLCSHSSSRSSLRQSLHRGHEAGLDTGERPGCIP